MNDKRPEDRHAYSQLGQNLIQRHSDQLSTQLSVFQSALINFGSDHGDEIRRNPEFRNKFTQMCQLIGVDPLELLIYSNSKNSKSRNEDFYIGLSVRIVEVCQETRDVNGGLISMKELLSRLQDNDNLEILIKESEIQQALSILFALGNGYEILNINGKKWLKFSSATSGNTNISNDQKKIYEVCGFMGGFVTYRLLIDNYGWDKIRCKTVIDQMIMDGFLWIDSQGIDGELQYWEPSWISN